MGAGKGKQKRIQSIPVEIQSREDLYRPETEFDNQAFYLEFDTIMGGYDKGQVVHRDRLGEFLEDRADGIRASAAIYALDFQEGKIPFPAARQRRPAGPLRGAATDPISSFNQYFDFVDKFDNLHPLDQKEILKYLDATALFRLRNAILHYVNGADSESIVSLEQKMARLCPWGWQAIEARREQIIEIYEREIEKKAQQDRTLAEEVEGLTF